VKKSNELLELGLVPGGEFVCRVVMHQRHRIDYVLGGERVLGEVFARLLRIIVDETDGLFPYGCKAPDDIGTAPDEVGRDRTTGCECVAVLIAQDVFGDDAGLERARDAELSHGRGLWLERIARIEGS
jgi:hypothetical protein